MKRVFLLAMFLWVTMYAYGQHKHLKGPAVRQYRQYLNEDGQAATSIVTVDQKQLVGPAAKNSQYHKGDKSPAYQPVKTLAQPERLMGPKARRTKPVKRPRPARFVPVKKKIYPGS